jgi:hypothetical protein
MSIDAPIQGRVYRTPQASTSSDGPRRPHHLVAGRDALEAAARRLCARGHSPETIAIATGLTVEAVNRILRAP